MSKNNISMVIFDMAGTIIDGPADLSHLWSDDDKKGCKAPVIAFLEVLEKWHIKLNWKTIREPMGLNKTDHLRLLVDTKEATQQFQEAFGHAITENEFAQMVDDLKQALPKAMLHPELVKPMEATEECFSYLERDGIIIATDTGYYADDAQRVLSTLRERYNLPIQYSTNGEVCKGRPSAAMVQHLMLEAGVDRVHEVIKVDDSAAGILSGRNAGVWTVAVYESGSDDKVKLEAAKPDFLIPDISHLESVIEEQIKPQLARGERTLYV